MEHGGLEHGGLEHSSDEYHSSLNGYDSHSGYESWPVASPSFGSDADEYGQFSHFVVTSTVAEQHEENQMGAEGANEVGVVRSLFQQAADVIATTLPYEAVELWAQRLGKQMPDEVQLALMKASFPVDKNLIRHYAYLSRETKGYNTFCDLNPGRERERFIVEDCMQIGFTLTGKLIDILHKGNDQKETMVAVSVDRRRVTSTLCSAHPDSRWCQHVVKLVFHRMDYPNNVQYRLPLSDSVQRLSERQLKQFVSLLIARRPLDMLAVAQETLDDLRRKDGTKSRDAKRDDLSVLEVPDLTAGGGIDDEGLWCVEETEVRRKVRECFRERFGRYRKIDVCEISSADSWFREVRRLRWDNQMNSTVLDEGVFSTSFHRDRFSKDVGDILHVVTALLRKGERSAIAALSTITEQWLDSLTSVVHIGSNDNCGTHSSTEMPVLKRSVHIQNIDLLSANGSWFLPDRIAVCWRMVVFGSVLGDGDLNYIRSTLKEWSKRLEQIVAVGVATANPHGNLLSHSKDRLPEVSNPDGGLWDSLSEWNGFEHVASLTDPKVCFLYALLSDIAVPPDSNPVLPPSFDRAEILNTVACFVVCLRDLGMEEAASRLARQCITAVLNLSVGEQFAEEHHVEAGTTGQPGTDILHEIAECHKEIASSLWGDQSANGVGKALVILFQAVEKGDWGWSTKKLYNLKPWLTPLKGEALLHELVDNSAAPLQVEASPAMFLALLCIMTYLNTRTLTAEQVEFESEKNRILSVIFAKMEEQQCDDILQQMTPLAVILEHNSFSCLDSPAIALFLLQIAILQQFDRHDHRQTFLPSIAAALRHQTIAQIELFKSQSSVDLFCYQTNSVDFYCFQTQCAASTLLALSVYGGSDEAAATIVSSLTDPLVEIFRSQVRTTETCHDKAADTGNISIMKKRQAVELDNQKLIDYLLDMTTVVEALCRETKSHDKFYGRQSLLAERLLFMKCSAVHLLLDDRTRRERLLEKLSIPIHLTRRLSELGQEVSCVTWHTAAEILFVLLEIESAIEGQKACRERLVELLRKATEHVGAVTIVEKLAEKGWNAVLTAEELMESFLFRDEFQQAFTHYNNQTQCRSPATIRVLEQMLVGCALTLPPSSRICTEFYVAARKLSMTDCLVRAVLSSDCDLKQKAPHALLFCLAHYGGGRVSVAERMDVGIEALNRWQQHCYDDISRRASIVALLDCEYEIESSVAAVMGLLRLAALAVFLDKEPQMAGGIAKRVRIGAVDSLLTAVANDWIDPLCAFILLVEVSRCSNEQWESVFSTVSECHPETWDISSLKSLLEKQDDFMKHPDAAASFREVCHAFPCAHQLAQTCKTRLAAFIARCKHRSDIDCFASSDDKLPSRELCLRDFISLEHLCQVFPDDEFDFDDLLQITDNQCKESVNCSLYMDVVKRFRKRRNGEADSEDDETDNSERVPSLLELLALQQMIQIQLGMSGAPLLPFCFDSDDSDDYY